MLEYLLRQSVLSLVKLLVFATLLFLLIQAIMPGYYVDQIAAATPGAGTLDMRRELGLDLPLGRRYLHWINDLFRLDLGTSFTGQPVADILGKAIPPTLFIFLAGTALAFLIGQWLGAQTGWAAPGWLSRLAALGGSALFTAFPPWLAWLLAYALTRSRGFAVPGEAIGPEGPIYHGLDRALWSAAAIGPATVILRMILTLLASALAILVVARAFQRLAGRPIPLPILALLAAGATIGLWYLLAMQALAFKLLGACWPAIVAYTLLSFGETMLIMQSSMARVVEEPYITTAQAKGLPAPAIRRQHAVRNALLPVLSRLVLSLPYLVTGLVIVESTVAWPGMGTTMWDALYRQNLPVVMATVLVIGVLSLAARLVLDIVMAYLDPRIRYDRQKPIIV